MQVPTYNILNPLVSTDYFNSNFKLLKEVVMTIKRGELYYADLSPVVGSEQGGVRPVLIVQNDVGNKYSPTIIAAAVTSKINKAKLPTHIELPSSTFGLAKDSVILLEQIRTLDKRRLKERIGELSPLTMSKVDKAILISLGFE
jgi:mRNA interferase MazF